MIFLNVWIKRSRKKSVLSTYHLHFFYFARQKWTNIRYSWIGNFKAQATSGKVFIIKFQNSDALVVFKLASWQKFLPSVSIQTLRYFILSTTSGLSHLKSDLLWSVGLAVGWLCAGGFWITCCELCARHSWVGTRTAKHAEKIRRSDVGDNTMLDIGHRVAFWSIPSWPR